MIVVNDETEQALVVRGRRSTPGIAGCHFAGRPQTPAIAVIWIH